jgi:hypothetical protein
MLNTPSAVLAVAAVVVAVNSFLFFGFYLPRTATTPTFSSPPPQTEPTTTQPATTQPTTTAEQTQLRTILEETTTSTATPTATATPSP